MAILNPRELRNSVKDPNNLLIVVAKGLIMELLKLPDVNRNHIRAIGEPYVKVAFFDIKEEIEANDYLNTMREQYPKLDFELQRHEK